MKSQRNLPIPWLRRLAASFSLRNLRTQLFLWIALPATVVLLALLLVQIASHTHAMRHLVQARADSLVEAVAALISTRIQHSEEMLAQGATVIATGADWQATGVQFFPGGLALYHSEGVGVEHVSAGAWLDEPSVRALVQTVVSAGAAGTVTVQEVTTGHWLLVQAVPVPGVPPRALLGATPVAALVMQDFVHPLAPSEDAGFHVEDAGGQTLLELAGDHSGENMTSHTVTAQAAVAPTGWRIVLRESWASLVPAVLRFDTAIYIVLGVAVVLSLLSTYFGLRRIVQPLQQLHVAAGQVGLGEVAPLHRPLGGVAEIEELRVALAQMADQVQQYQQLLHRYIDAVTLGQEEERKRLARELHDDTVQALIALNQQVELAETELGHDPQRAAQRLGDLRPLLTAAIANLRRHLQNLRPLYLEDLGFVAALEMLVRQTAAQHGLVGDFEVSGEPERTLPPAVQISAYRIVQEALQNVANHARASWVHVELLFEPDAIVLRIEDDGVGFAVADHPQQLAQVGHYGLLGMQERARLHGGALRIESEPGTGATVTVRLLAPVNAHGNKMESL
jgi:signal transduction histidine kinase